MSRRVRVPSKPFKRKEPKVHYFLKQDGFIKGSSMSYRALIMLALKRIASTKKNVMIETYVNGRRFGTEVLWANRKPTDNTRKH